MVRSGCRDRPRPSGGDASAQPLLRHMKYGLLPSPQHPFRVQLEALVFQIGMNSVLAKPWVDRGIVLHSFDHRSMLGRSGAG